MYITWLGHSCFKIEEKIGNDLITVVTDPYGDSVGLRLPKTKADIISVSHGHDDHSNVDAILPAADRPPIILDRSGEYEVKGVAVVGIGSYHDKERSAVNQLYLNLNLKASNCFISVISAPRCQIRSWKKSARWT